MTRQALSQGRAVPILLVSFAIVFAAVKKTWRRRRVLGPAVAMIAFGSWSTWHAIGYPSGWVEGQGHVLATEDLKARNPFKNSIVRFETEEGWRVDFLDRNAAVYLERGIEAARRVPIAYDPKRPKQAMILAEDRWQQPLLYLLVGLVLAVLALLWPERRRSVR